MDPDDSNLQELAAREILARRIRLLRTIGGWSQEVLAELALLHRTYIGALEHGEVNPCLDNIEKIAKAFEVPVWTLLDERFENLLDQNIDTVEELRPVYGNRVPPCLDLPAPNQNTPFTGFLCQFLGTNDL